ncbi:ABC transporter ATP-binding protein [Thalassolituus marinus]|uniref:ATP-binding cassette domain-containing protein n=1 Tax=Thalassolituus marinus TaxID=671053 RepID=A0ABS7ZQ68_9GAMM|nr:ATP-binding cassette domain-containing protein [Thalassolituus marinus]MCA6063759.1 ATP-binding cassette domain-containing protein [Thalassolituus marinus]
MTRLTMHEISQNFATRRVLGPVSMTLEQGEAVALVGPSGSGKTTLLNIAAGLLIPSEGVLRNDFAKPTLMFQQPRLLPWKTALDNIALGLKARGVPGNERQFQAQEIGLQLGLSEEDLLKYPAALSGGMQSRVALARALLPQPDLLLLDEAFSALDIGLKAELYRYLQQAISDTGCSLLMITHDPAEAMRLVDRIIVLGGNPGHICYEFHTGGHNQRQQQNWLLERTRDFLGIAAVRAAFHLEPA